MTKNLKIGLALVALLFLDMFGILWPPQIPQIVQLASSTISNLADAGGISSSDYFLIVTDTGGTPTTERVDVADVFSNTLTVQFGNFQDDDEAGNYNLSIGPTDGSSGSRNVDIGDGAGNGATGSNGTRIGVGAGEVSTGGNNSFSGRNSGSGSIGDSLSCYGMGSCQDSSGTQLTCEGFDACRDLTGDRVTGSGYEAWEGATGHDNTGDGFRVGITTTGSFLTLYGVRAGAGVTEPNSLRTCFGYECYKGANVHDTRAGLDEAADACIGMACGRNSSALGSFFGGYRSGEEFIGPIPTCVGGESCLKGAGIQPNFMGLQAGMRSDTDYAIGIGSKAGQDSQGNYAIMVGREAGVGNLADNILAIGHGIGVTGTMQAGEIQIGNTQITTTAWISGSFTTGDVVIPGTLMLNFSTPITSTMACDQEEIKIDADYLYVCTSTNTWKRTALSSW